jgi:glycosyltransferase involved in cell wall biosynthesis
MTNVLFISAWYPNRYDSMFGLFVQKHAEAVSLYCNVKVLYVHADEMIDCVEIIKQQNGNVQEITVYYPSKKAPIFSKLRMAFQYAKAYWIGYEEITKNGFVIDITHVNVLTRTGVMAYLLKLHKGTPYVITEHWTRYLASRNSYNGIIRKLITQKIVKKAAAILPVSEDLMNAMLTQHLTNSNYHIVNNVVNSFFFNEKEVIPRQKKRIIHISCFNDDQKNITGILRATHELSKTRTDFELVLIGNGINYEAITEYAEKLEFPKGIINFVGEKQPNEVALWLKNSDFFIMFSNYENSPVVISESLVCGKPVLSSNVGGISEHINMTNGILVDARDEMNLVIEMNNLLDKFKNYDTDRIKKTAKLKFSFESIGAIISEIYQKALNTNSTTK